MKTQDSFDYDVKAHARHDDPETSRIAAEAQIPRVSKACARVLAYLCYKYPHGATDEEGQRALNMHSYRRRRADLKNGGLVRVQFTGNGKRSIKRKSKRGLPMHVWVATEKGRTWN